MGDLALRISRFLATRQGHEVWMWKVRGLHLIALFMCGGLGGKHPEIHPKGVQGLPAEKIFQCEATEREARSQNRSK